MHSPSKTDKLLVQEEDSALETGRDGIPQEIWNDLVQRENFIYYSLMFLNASVLWAYYSCLSAQDFYTSRFPRSGLDFSFLTTLITSWPAFTGQLIQVVTGLDKKISMTTRVYIGYSIYLVFSILIMVFSAIEFSSEDEDPNATTNSGEKTGATLVLICFGIIGFGSSFTEATYYTLAALFPVEKFTNGVQIGNTKSSTNTSFYLFFSVLVVVLLAAMYLYRKLVNIPSVKFLMDRNEESARAKGLLNQSVLDRLSNLGRIFRIIWVPAITQFFVLFVSLVVFPGFACTATRNLSVEAGYSDKVFEITPFWYCSPGIIGSYNFGDFFGRIFCGVLAYKIFTMKLSLSLSVLRFADNHWFGL
ncbi:hypothetical protein PybrP1_011009 [[Pythium] brassicae (nom. inval.)]|nr:hypothetical protein PybrP1_011009 [[Pythium] brassicae (nom. inval.)]